MKKIVFYISNGKTMFGTREHRFDWEEGDTIWTDGVAGKIYKVAEYHETAFNNIIIPMMKACRKVSNGTHEWIDKKMTSVDVFKKEVDRYCSYCQVVYK